MTELTEALRAQGLGWSDPSKWPIEKREAARKMLAAADIIDAALAATDAPPTFAQTLARTFDGTPFPRFVSADDLSAILHGTACENARPGEEA